MKKSVRLTVDALETRDVPVGDLIVSNVTFKFPGPITVPGDPGFVRFTVQNVGEHVSNPSGSLAGVHLYLSDTGNPFDQDYFLGRVANKNFKLAPGGSRSFTALVEMPKLDLPYPAISAGNYFILAEVDPGHVIDEASDGNNITASATSVDYQFQYGVVGERRNVVLEANGIGPLRFSLPGGGTGSISAPGDGNVDLNLSNTLTRTTVNISGAGSVLLRNVTADFPVGNVTMPRTTISGDMLFSGGLKQLVLAALASSADNASLTIQNNTPVSIVIGEIQDADITVNKGINAFLIGDWTDTNGDQDSIHADYIKKIVSKNFEAGIVLKGPGYNAKRQVLGSALIDGRLRDSVWGTAVEGAVFGKIQADEAEDWQLLVPDGKIDQIRILGDYRNPSFPNFFAVAANFIGVFKVGGEVSIGWIEADAPDEKNMVIKELRFGNVTHLEEITAIDGGIGSIYAKDWPARSNIEAQWIDLISLSNPGLVQNSYFAANLTLTGVKPRTNTALRSFQGGSVGKARFGAIIGGSESDPAIWQVGNIDLLSTYGTNFWQLNAGSIGKFTLEDDISNSQLILNSAKLISAYSIANSTIKAAGTIQALEQKQGLLLNPFVNSTVEANYINRLVLRDVDGSLAPCYIRAREINSYVRFAFSMPANPAGTSSMVTVGTYDPVQNFFIEIIT